MNKLKLTIKIILAIGISFFKAITELAWGLASIFLLLGLVLYFKQDITSISPLLLNLFKIVQENMMWFLLIFFGFYLFRYIGEAKNE